VAAAFQFRQRRDYSVYAKRSGPLANRGNSSQFSPAMAITVGESILYFPGKIMSAESAEKMKLSYMLFP